MYNQNSTISYSANIVPILNTYCNSCHTYPGSGGIDLNYYTGVKNAALSGQLIHAMQHDTNYVIMPPPPAQAVDTCQRYAIRRWIIEGCPNN
ncbi:MAG: hypothetical protein JST26_13160 [Bacteroidetes bacterium]|nr:hypothetical protein [Bacteroidota bacterium]